MKEIKLTNGTVMQVDDEDYEWGMKSKWTNVSGYAKSGIAGRTMTFHREIMDVKKGEQIDHVDGNRLNNQKANLRVVTQQQNSQNKKLHKNNTTGYKGVHPFREKFRACIAINGKTIHLGLYHSAVEAAEAYDAKAKELYGEFAKLNFTVQPAQETAVAGSH